MFDKPKAKLKGLLLALAAAAALLVPARSPALFDPCDVPLGGDWIGVLNPNDFQACYPADEAKGPPPLFNDYVIASNREGTPLYHLWGATNCNPDGFIGGMVEVHPVEGKGSTLIPVLGRFRSRLALVRTFGEQRIIDTAKLNQAFSMKGLLRDGMERASLRVRGSNKKTLTHESFKAGDKIIPPPEFFQEILLERMRWNVLGCLLVTGSEAACFDLILKYALANCAFSTYYLNGPAAEFTKPNFGRLQTTGYFDSPMHDFAGGIGTVTNTFFDPVRDRLGRNATSLRIGKLWTRSTAIGFLTQEDYEDFLDLSDCFYSDPLLGDFFEHGFIGYSTPGSTSTYTDRTLSLVR